MIQVNILRSEIITNSAIFETQELADAWLAQGVQNNWFGKPERWERDSELFPLSQEEKDSSLEQREVEDSGQMFQEYLLPSEYEVQQIDLGNAPKMETLRAKRDDLLSKCDWTQLVDSPLSTEKKEAWAVYRQALRDLPATVVDINNPVWPEQPQ